MFCDSKAHNQMGDIKLPKTSKMDEPSMPTLNQEELTFHTDMDQTELRDHPKRQCLWKGSKAEHGDDQSKG